MTKKTEQRNKNKTLFFCNIPGYVQIKEGTVHYTYRLNNLNDYSFVENPQRRKNLAVKMLRPKK